jgi:copper resistance protein B
MDMSRHAISDADMNGAPPLPETLAPAPPAPTDYVADKYFDPASMRAARAALKKEHGGETYSKVMINLAEYQARRHGDGYRWDGQAWIGGDINRFVVKTEGDGDVKAGVQAGEVQALYSRAVGPYTDLQAGVRYVAKPGSPRTYASIGVQALVPYWIDLEGALFVSDKGVLARAEGSYDLRITQRLVLQPRVELNLAAQTIRSAGIGAGVSDAELGLRLRYEIERQFAPYVGVTYDRQFGLGADLARAGGEDSGRASFVLGVRAWF